MEEKTLYDILKPYSEDPSYFLIFSSKKNYKDKPLYSGYRRKFDLYDMDAFQLSTYWNFYKCDEHETFYRNGMYVYLLKLKEGFSFIENIPKDYAGKDYQKDRKALKEYILANQDDFFTFFRRYPLSNKSIAVNATFNFFIGERIKLWKNKYKNDFFPFYKLLCLIQNTSEYLAVSLGITLQEAQIILFRDALKYAGFANPQYVEDNLYKSLLFPDTFDIVDIFVHPVNNLKNKNVPQWVKKAFFSGAKYSIKNGVFIWETGIWNKGAWKEGIWKEGTWKQGIWENGVWGGGVWKEGEWKNGIWKSGEWKNGTWQDGIWENGVWKQGGWLRGTWKNGTWENGGFGNLYSLYQEDDEKPIWENGVWKKGDFFGVWKDGTWKDGDFHGVWKNGTWENGTFLDDEYYESRFSTSHGIWEDGIWKGGVWRKGTWKNGTWENGTWKNGIWKGGTWKGGVWERGFIEDGENNFMLSTINPKEYFGNKKKQESKNYVQFLKEKFND